MDLLKKLTSVFAPSGREEKICELIKSEVIQYADEISVDTLGNLIVHKKGNSKRIMIAAHMDEIGIIVTAIDDDGYIRFSQVGGLNNSDLVGRRVVFENGSVGVIGTEKDNKDRKISKMYIDVGAKKLSDVTVSVGDMACFEQSYFENDSVIISKSLDNRAGCYVLIEAMKRIKSDNDIYFVFTAQEEVGLRGAKTAAFSISPDYALAIDVTDTGDTPEKINIATKLGSGACIKVIDKSVLCHFEIRTLLIKLAQDKKIDYQLEVMNNGGTDAGAVSLSGEGVKTGGISIPTRYIHSPSEMIYKKDLNDAVKLLCAFLEYNF